MFERIEAKIAERDILQGKLKEVRKYFESIFRDIGYTKRENENGETYWHFQFPPFRHNDHDYVVEVGTKPTNQGLENTEIRLTLWPKVYKEDSEEAWLPPINKISEFDRQQLSKIMPDLEVIVKALKNLPGLRPGYLGA